MSRSDSAPSTDYRVGVLFVCLGNICRSPLAKVIFDHHARRAGLIERIQIDSCGTGGWHEGEGADPRSIKIAAERGLRLDHVARKLHHTDFEKFNYLIAMDRSNRTNMLNLGAPPARVHLLRAFDPALAAKPEHELEVPDPYYGGDDGFAKIYDMIDAACSGLLKCVAESTLRR